MNRNTRNTIGIKALNMSFETPKRSNVNPNIRLAKNPQNALINKNIRANISSFESKMKSQKPIFIPLVFHPL